MDQPVNTNNQSVPAQPAASNVTPEQLKSLKDQIIKNVQIYAMTGDKTSRTPEPDDIGDKSTYDYWDKQDTFENSQWSTYYWKFNDGKWEIQLTKIELRPDGHSQMATYSIKPDTDPNFPGIQVYLEERDKGYRPAESEDVVYLDRVIGGLVSLSSG